MNNEESFIDEEINIEDQEEVHKKLIKELEDQKNEILIDEITLMKKIKK